MVNNRHRKQWMIAGVFLAPNILGFAVFTFLPVLASFALAFCEWDLFSHPKFVGLSHFRQLLGFTLRDSNVQPPWYLLMFLFSLIGMAVFMIWRFRSPGLRWPRGYAPLRVSLWIIMAIAFCWVIKIGCAIWQPNTPRFWYYIYNTLFLMIGVPLNTLGSLALASLLNQKLRGVKIFRTIYFLPSIVAGVGTMILWKWVYNPDFGLINRALATIGISGPAWLFSTAWAKPALILMGFWGAVGGINMILYLAALQNIDPQYYEASDLDGANWWQKFWAITWPMVSPTTFFVVITGIIGGFQGGLEAVIVMTGGGPARSTTTIGYHIYQTAFEWFYMGRASAMSWILFVIILSITLLIWRFGERKVHY